jgi:hypothetical protein
MNGADWAIDQDVSMVATEYGAVLLNQVHGDYWQLNVTGTQIINGVLSGQTPDEVAGAIATEYGQPESAVRDDVDELLGSLCRARLLRPATPL